MCTRRGEGTRRVHAKGNQMDWDYESWASGEPYEWGGAARGMSAWDSYDFHVDLGCGTVKKGRIGIDKFPAPGVNIVMDLDTLDVYGITPGPNGDAAHICRNDEIIFQTPNQHAGQHLWKPDDPVRFVTHRGLPFEDSSIKSIVSHHCLEHIGPGFLALIAEVYRVLEPDGIFRAITPLFPSRSAVDDPTHVRWFTESTWEFCCGKPGKGGHWMESFSVPYTTARFEKVDQDVTEMFPPHQRWTDVDAREIRVALKANK